MMLEELKYQMIVVATIAFGAFFLILIFGSIFSNRRKKMKLKKQVARINNNILDLIINIVVDGQEINESVVETFMNSYSRELGIHKNLLLRNFEYVEDAIVVIYSMDNLSPSIKEQATARLSTLKKELTYEDMIRD